MLQGCSGLVKILVTYLLTVLFPMSPHKPLAKAIQTKPAKKSITSHFQSQFPQGLTIYLEAMAGPRQRTGTAALLRRLLQHNTVHHAHPLFYTGDDLSPSHFANAKPNSHGAAWGPWRDSMPLTHSRLSSAFESERAINRKGHRTSLHLNRIRGWLPPFSRRKYESLPFHSAICSEDDVLTL